MNLSIEPPRFHSLKISIWNVCIHNWTSRYISKPAIQQKCIIFSIYGLLLKGVFKSLCYSWRLNCRRQRMFSSEVDEFTVAGILTWAGETGWDWEPWQEQGVEPELSSINILLKSVSSSKIHSRKLEIHELVVAIEIIWTIRSSSWIGFW